VGDRFYRGNCIGSEDSVDGSNTVLPGDPGYILHSWRLSYRDPFSGRDVEVVAPVRREIMEWCERAGYAIVGDEPNRIGLQ
jgi:hypothetical protein